MMIKALLLAGADLSITDNQGSTPRQDAEYGPASASLRRIFDVSNDVLSCVTTSSVHMAFSGATSNSIASEVHGVVCVRWCSSISVFIFLVFQIQYAQARVD